MKLHKTNPSEFFEKKGEPNETDETVVLVAESAHGVVRRL